MCLPWSLTQSPHTAHEKQRRRSGSKLYVLWGVEGKVSSLESQRSPALMYGHPGDIPTWWCATSRNPQGWPSGLKNWGILLKVPSPSFFKGPWCPEVVRLPGAWGWNQPASSSLQGKQTERGCSGRGWNSKAVRMSCPWLTWVCLWPVAEFSTRLGTSEGTPWTWACFSGWSGQDQHLGAGREAPGGVVLRFEGSLSQAQTLLFPDLECEGLVELYTLPPPYSWPGSGGVSWTSQASWACCFQMGLSTETTRKVCWNAVHKCPIMSDSLRPHRP